jgi:hypothetical protein
VNKTILDLGIWPIQNNSDLPPGLASSAVETAFSVMSANDAVDGSSTGT